MANKLKIILLAPYLPAKDTTACAKKIYDCANVLYEKGHLVYLFSFCSKEDIQHIPSISPYCKECWTGRKAGSSQDYGDHGSIENYRAVVDHALDRAVAAVAGDATFQDALCSNNCLNAKPESEVAAPSTSLKKRTAKRHK